MSGAEEIQNSPQSLSVEAGFLSLRNLFKDSEVVRALWELKIATIRGC
jgi:hypothetical protein